VKKHQSEKPVATTPYVSTPSVAVGHRFNWPVEQAYALDAGADIRVREHYRERGRWNTGAAASIINVLS
jgi:hypothetical protein